MNQEEIKKEYKYHRSGKLIRRKDNTVVEGCDNGSGYIVVQIRRKKYYLHRLIFCLHFGFYPKSVDHKNQKRSDNRISNLRAAKHHENLMNIGISKRNTTGHKGIYFDKRDRAWYSQVMICGKTINTAWSRSKAVVIKKHRQALRELHGEFVRFR